MNVKETLQNGHSAMSSLVKVYDIADPIVRIMIENLAKRMDEHYYNSIDYALCILDMIDYQKDYYEQYVLRDNYKEISESFKQETGLDFNSITKYTEFKQEWLDTVFYIGATSLVDRYIKLMEYMYTKSDTELVNIKLEKYS